MPDKSADVEIRLSRPGDEPLLKGLWKIAFGDEDTYIDVFFKNCYRPGNAVLAEVAGDIASAIYILPAGQLDGISCAYAYALATLPRHRGRGLGTFVTKAGIAHSFRLGYGCNIICPAGTSLFPYYEKMGYGRFFFIRKFSAPFCPSGRGKNTGAITPVSFQAYGAMRKKLLPPLSVDFTPPFLAHLSTLCALSGGGLYRIDLADTVGCAAVESAAGSLLIKELLFTDDHLSEAAALLGRCFKAKQLTAVTPADSGESPGRAAVPHALAVFAPGIVRPEGMGYFPFVFD